MDARPRKVWQIRERSKTSNEINEAMLKSSEDGILSRQAMLV